MRPIKFRAWNLIDKKMEPVCGIVWEGDAVLDLNIGGIGYGVSYHDPIGDYKLMQFTGLKDKNGKEIWEGDILGWPNDSFRDVVKFGSYENDEIVGTGFYVEDKAYGISSLRADEQQVVLGNIYENPELLK